MAVTDLHEVVETIEAEVKEALRLPALDAIRSIANEAGIRRARTMLRDAPDIVEAAKRDLRNAQNVERDARESYDTALLEAEWELDGRFVTEGNKTYLVDGEERRAMTADERKAWKAEQAKRAGSVAAAAKALREAEAATARARDAVDTAENRLTAAKHDLTAAVAELQVLAIGLQAKEL